MTISTTDIKLRTPERLTDNPDGGGRQTSGTIVDGQLKFLTMTMMEFPPLW